MDTRILKFGKKPATVDARDLRFNTYRTDKMVVPPPHPAQFGHEGLIGADAWGMLGNDQVGDCTCAGSDHETMLWTLEGGNPAQFTDANTISDYSAISGYNPDDPSSDCGANVRDVLKYRQKTGMIDSAGHRHKIGAFLALDLANMDDLLEALYLFSAVALGIQVPQSALDQFQAGQPWDVSGDNTIMGGHYIPLVACRDNLVCVTWGQTQQLTTAFYQTYCDEAWAILSPEMLKDGVTLEGYNLNQLKADLSAL